LIKVEMYSKPGCHLCDIARDVILSANEELPFEFVETDINKDKDLYTKYKDDIPVIYINGRFFNKYNVDRTALIDKLNSL